MTAGLNNSSVGMLLAWAGHLSAHDARQKASKSGNVRSCNDRLQRDALACGPLGVADLIKLQGPCRGYPDS